MTLLDWQPLARLRDEFRLSMRRLWLELCRDLHVNYAVLAQSVSLPVPFFVRLRARLEPEAFSNWKVVGWIETLNDLVYFLDILQQFKREPDQSEFVAQLFEECREKFFEHGYANDLFPSGQRQVRGLEKRLLALCQRLAQELTQESLWFDPAWSAKWSRQQHGGQWDLPGTLIDDPERGTPAHALPADLAGAYCMAPPNIRRTLRQSSGAVLFQVAGGGISIKVGAQASPVWNERDGMGRWVWDCQVPVVAAEGKQGAVTVGHTLVYGKNRQPKTVQPTDPRQVKRITRAWQTIKQAWPEGHEILSLLTTHIVPLQARGVVSFSYRHRPGLSFVNCFDRDNLDLIDDLIHENSHHHLNLLLRKQVMYHRDHNQQIFYSPWRRSLRPLRGILHATFTFTIGALLFERLVSWSSGPRGLEKWKAMGLTQHDLRRARLRCLEEVESVRYSLHDLHYADHQLRWLTGSGRALVRQLKEILDHVDRSSAEFKPGVLRSSFGPVLRKQIAELEAARRAYGPMRLEWV